MTNQMGIIRVLPLLLIVATIGILSFLLISSTAPFGGQLKTLFPKKPSLAAGNSFYVDCSAGNDSNNGTSQTNAWKTFSRASTATLNSSDTLFLKRNCTWEGPITISWSGVTITAYGTSTDPLPRIQLSTGNKATNVITVTGSNNVLDSLFVRSDPPAVVPNPDPNAGKVPSASSPGIFNAQIRATGCPGTGYGIRSIPGVPGVDYRYGVVLNGNSNTLQNSKFTELVDGVTVVGSGNKVLHNEIYNINQNGALTLAQDDNGDGVVSQGDATHLPDKSATEDYGSQGVELNGSNNIVAYNYIHDNRVCSYDFYEDGSQVTIFPTPNAVNNIIHHNRGDNSVNFVETGVPTGTKVDGNVFAYNVSTNETFYVGGRGTTNTKLYNNTVYGRVKYGGVSGGDTVGVMENNIFDTAGAQFWGSHTITENHNIFWGPNGATGVCVVTNNSTCDYSHTTTSTTDKFVDPLFVLAGSDFHLKSTSPAINAGITDSITAGFSTDYDSGVVPSGSGVDIGAYEFGSQPLSTPTPVPTPTPTPQPAGVNLLQNNSFEGVSLAPWSFNARTPAAGSANVDTTTKADGATSLRLNITTASQSSFFVQLQQQGFNLIAGQTFTGSFWAKAANPRSINVAVQLNGGNFDVYTNPTFNLTSSWQQYSFTVTPPATVSGLIAFNVANDLNSVWIDNVSLAAGLAQTPTPTPTPTPTASPSPCQGADLDYNGKVDLFDYNILVGNYNKTGTSILGDIDNNGKVDLFDYNIFVGNFNKSGC